MKRCMVSAPSIGTKKRRHSSSYSIVIEKSTGINSIQQSESYLLNWEAPDESNCDLQTVVPSHVISPTFHLSSQSKPVFMNNIAVKPKQSDSSSMTDVLSSVNSSFTCGDYKTGVIFEDSFLHVDLANRFHPERTARVTCIYDTLIQAGIRERCALFEYNSEIAPKSCSEYGFLTQDDYLRVHIPGYMGKLETLAECTCQEKLDIDAQQFQSVYFTPYSVNHAKNAAASLCRLVSRVVQGKLDNGFAVIRPPGHHAEPGMAGGYCLINNIAVAAAYARDFLGLAKVLIIDWDIHHGNGTQAAFLDDPRVMYISIHRWQRGNFYPFQSHAGPTMVGVDRGKGFNVNIGWNRKGMGDWEYYAAWNTIVLPMVREYAPDLVLVSAGFDAAPGDTGECHVTPECFGRLTQSLMSISNGKVVCSLEGGYVRSVLGECVLCVVEALLKRNDNDDFSDLVDLDDIESSAAASIQATLTAHASYWKCFQRDC